MGAWFPGGRVVYRGKDLLNELKDISWVGLLLFGITGRFFNEKQVRLFEGLWSLSASFPDPRLWNNRVAALAGTARSTGNLAVSGAVAVSEARIYGRGADIRAIDFLLRTKSKIDAEEDLGEIIREELRERRVIPGYGRPITNKDERIVPVKRLAEELGFLHGTYVELAFNIEQQLARGRWRMRMNIAALCAALAADQGLSRQEYYHISIPSFIAGILPCFIDSTQKPEGSFLPLRCQRVLYEGKLPRTWNWTSSESVDTPIL